MSLGKKKIQHQAAAGEFVNTENFAPVLYTGNGTIPGPVLNYGFQPDLVWVKGRSIAKSGRITDVTMTEYQNLDPTNTNSISTSSTDVRVNLDYTSTSARIETGSEGWNSSGSTYVAWGWKAGGAAVSNTDGVTSGSVTAVTSTVSANQDAGFSINKFTTPSSGFPSWGHGLSESPELIILKATGLTQNWIVYAPSILGQKDGYLNTNAAFTSYSPDIISVDSSKIDLGRSGYGLSGSSDYIAYCFHSVDGYQKVGSYSGAAARATVSGLGFKPRFVMIKNTTTANTDWYMWDNQRNTITDKLNNYLLANESDTESGASTYALFVGDTQTAPVTNYEDGFQVAAVDNVQINKTGNTYIYLAIA